jgi:ParB-like chromosome segregation protein Spo0J
MRTGGWQGGPIKVVEHNGKRYVIDGHHRVEAARRAGIDVQYEIASPSEMAMRGYKSIDDVIRAASEAGPNRLR